MTTVGSFGEALKRLRGDMTQGELALASSVPRATIAGLESDKAKEPRWETAVSLAKALGRSLDEFAGAGELSAAFATPHGLDRLAKLEEAVDLNLQRMEHLENIPGRFAMLAEQVAALTDAVRQSGIAVPTIGIGAR
jgi:transcriptional regulator with XRE-family HTH domain